LNQLIDLEGRRCGTMLETAGQIRHPKSLDTGGWVGGADVHNTDFFQTGSSSSERRQYSTGDVEKLL
jgi:hypothetical protein